MNEKALQIIYEDKYLLVVNKPSGIMVEEDRAGNQNLNAVLLDYLKGKVKGEIFLANVHRLDRPASGVLVYARKKSALKNLSDQFQKRTLTKTYLAVTSKAPQVREGRLVNWLVKDVATKKAIIYSQPRKEAQQVELIYKIKDEKDGFFFWEVELLTGKYHQIRAQLSFAGCPIVGDEKYGSDKHYRKDGICLHARSLKLQHPFTSEPMMLSADVPEEFPWSLVSF